jgi:hypothetical protein
MGWSLPMSVIMLQLSAMKGKKPFLQLILYPNKHEKVIDTIRWNRHYPQINYLKTNELDANEGEILVLELPFG